MRAVGLREFDERVVRTRSDSADLGAPISTGDAVVTRSDGS
jgi:hypothetical protein